MHVDEDVSLLKMMMFDSPQATIETVGRTLSGRRKKSIDDQPLMPAAVLVLMLPKDGECSILFTKRAEGVEHHKGEISFPGGSKEPEDHDFLETALRETSEEMGIRCEDVKILGELDDVETRSRFGVRVFVGAIPYPYPFKPSPREIAEVLEVPIRVLADTANWREEVRWVDGQSNKAYCYAYGEHLIYGATARIVAQFLEIIPNTPGP